MASITTRAGKGSALTHTEVDNNFSNLNTDKVDKTGAQTMAGALTAAGFIPSSSTVPTNGVFLPTANTLGISTNSTEQARIGSGGQFSVTGAGTASAPVYSKSDDLNTGVWFPAADTVAVSTGGSERLRITSGGLVGIGATPAYTNQLVVKGATAAGESVASSIYQSDTTANSSVTIALACGGDGGASTQSRSARICAITNGNAAGNGHALAFQTSPNGAGPVEGMRITSAQDVLIGVTTKTANGGRLELDGGITFPATDVAASNANTLDDYEEGTWTVEFYDAQTGGNVSPTTGTGRYTKIGRQVSAHFSILNISTSGMTAANTLYFTLPFTAANQEFVGTVHTDTIAYGSGRTAVVAFVQGANQVRGNLLQMGSGVGFAGTIVSNITSGTSDIKLTITYFV